MNDIQFLQELIRVDSSNPPGNETKVSEILADRCKKSGLPYSITDLDENRSNFEIRLKGKNRSELFFCGHMDTVLPGKQAWDYPPFAAERVNNKLYGRGTSDMKSGLAAMFLAVESLFLEEAGLPHDVVFLATAGEEVDSCGARKYMEDQGVSNVAAMVIGEPTREKVVIGHKGALWVEILTFGKTAHGAMPNQGINAIEQMKKVMALLDECRLNWKVTGAPLGESSLSINKIDGGMQANVVPDQCSVYVDIRTIPPQSHKELFSELKTKLQALFVGDHEVGTFQVQTLLDRPGILTESSSRIIQTAKDVKGADNDVYGVSYYTDAAVLNPESNIPTLIYGPGDEQLAHQPNEYVDIDAYLRSIEYYKTLALAFEG
ncbi:M20 family metallopeptidase [Natribacillus halophilus]|uniref:Succinyl-diaminopimelate desuccinylase n=1 Tax=Natribacillus halophilus TaxID=549003 RepID=A0A1G8N1K7_9BACI|nr:M20 family metallopeptidase [Natribacillus halophilus]SDI73490.1 succinyl-diaminopimelate desuccinylase [Natribacillus halophilus]